MNEAVATYCEDTLREVNSIGKLQEWIEALPLVQVLWGQNDIPVSPAEAGQIEIFMGGATGADKNAVWEEAIQWVAGVIYTRASNATKIIWRVKPDLAPLIEGFGMPENVRAILEERGHDFAVHSYFRAAFIKEK